MSEGVRFYLLYHLFLDGFFDILDFLSFVTINQHDLTQEYTFIEADAIMTLILQSQSKPLRYA